ncbi:VOC family protein [Deinococcus sonorensis]|uniref:VOC family protein n=2 Tax=Deinococcus sonorensis TaxID=309891 RepID=A0AAU7UEW8_9DEIO
MDSSPILDLAAITLEVNHLERAVHFYAGRLGLPLQHRDDQRGVATLQVGPQKLRLWQPITRQQNAPRLAPLLARGASHLHYAFQVPMEQLPRCREQLDRLGLEWSEVEMSAEGEPADPALYFFDPFGHGLELRGVRPDDQRQPLLRPAEPGLAGLPIVGLREAALAFGDYAAMKERLPRAYGFAFLKEQPDRNFAQFTLAPQPQPDGQGTPQRWLYAWDPQVGLADMLGGDHALVSFYADVDRVEERVRAAGLPCLRDAQGLAVRDPEGHVFEFLAAPSHPA